MGVFNTEKQLDQYKASCLMAYADKYQIDAVDITKLDDMCRTLMAEYSRLLQEGKIRRPYIYSAEHPRPDITTNILGGEIIS